jgi:hypothetical protein
MRTTIVIAVLLLSGTNARAAGRESQPTARQSPWADYWAGWGRRLRVCGQVYWHILKTPNLGYRVEGLEVYPNGVYAEFGVTNPGRATVYLAIAKLVSPVRRMSMTDDRGREWQVPRFRGSVNFREPDEFVSVPAGGTVWYRYRLSFIEDKPLELVAQAPGMGTDRPAELAYFVADWHKAYRRLTEHGKEPIDMYAIGTGRVTVKWFDKPYPKESPAPTRYFGPGGAK